VAFLGLADFVVLIDVDSFMQLLRVCARAQVLSPLAESLGLTSVPCALNYENRFLLDIVRDFALRPLDENGFPQYSHHVARAAFAFIIGHEVAHIAHGHLEFLASSEFKSFCKTDADAALTLKTLEMDADSSGTTSAFGIVENFLQNHRKDIPTAEIENFDRWANFVRRRAITGVYIATLYAESRATNHQPKNYPIGYLRFLTTQNIFSQVLQMRGDAEASFFPEMVRATLVASFAALNGSEQGLGHPIATNIEIFEPRQDDPILEYSPIGVEIALDALEPLHARWAKLRPFLERYKIGGSLAPACRDPL
jgi:hypothetical protein